MSLKTWTSFLCDNSIIEHDRSFRLKVRHLAISSEIHFFVTVNNVTLNEFITVCQDMAAYILVAPTAWFISEGNEYVLQYHMHLVGMFTEDM